MPPGTGIWLNNSLAYCTFEPKGNPMDAHAGRRKLSGDCPTIVMRDGRPWIAIGTPGGHTIGQTVPQMVMNLLDFGMDIRQAIAAPRVSFVEPDTLGMEEDIPAAVRDALAAMGHRIRVGRGLGNAHGLTIEYDAGGQSRSGSPARRTRGAPASPPVSEHETKIRDHRRRSWPVSERAVRSSPREMTGRRRASASTSPAQRVRSIVRD